VLQRKERLRSRLPDPITALAVGELTGRMAEVLRVLGTVEGVFDTAIASNSTSFRASTNAGLGILPKPPSADAQKETHLRFINDKCQLSWEERPFTGTMVSSLWCCAARSWGGLSAPWISHEFCDFVV